MLFVRVLLDLLGFTIYFLRSSGVGQYSIPLRFVIQRQAPDLVSSFISSNAPLTTSSIFIYPPVESMILRCNCSAIFV
uniref:Secreted protein n=1 Tax=Arundo donax TaxID=35708 RepID=A0A0A9D251_ARUDO